MNELENPSCALLPRFLRDLCDVFAPFAVKKPVLPPNGSIVPLFEFRARWRALAGYGKIRP